MKLTLGHHYNFDTNYTFVPSAETVDSYEGEIIVQSSGSRFPGAMHKSNGCVYDTTGLYWGRYIENPLDRSNAKLMTLSLINDKGDSTKIVEGLTSFIFSLDGKELWYI